MIQSKKDLKDYIRTDIDCNHFPSGIWRRFNIVYHFLKSLRYLEYYTNVKPKSILRRYYALKNYVFSVVSGITIMPNSFGKGLYIPHHGTIVVNGSAHFGDYCVVQAGVNVSKDVNGGRYVFLSAGAKIMIGVKIADYVIVGANAVVTKDINEPNTVWAGVPAKYINSNGMKVDHDF